MACVAVRRWEEGESCELCELFLLKERIGGIGLGYAIVLEHVQAHILLVRVHTRV